MLPDEITTLRRHWQHEEPSSDLADRIVAHALAHKQHRPWSARLRDAFARPHQGFTMKGMAFAACLMVAIIAIDRTGDTKTKKPQTYSKPMEQIVEEMLWSDYKY